MAYRVSGNRIQHNGINIRLFGVNVIGAELNEGVIGGLWAGLTIQQYLAIIKGQKFNCLRIPIGPKCLSNQAVDPGQIATWMEENAFLIGKGSLEIMDEWIAECERQGIRYIFDLHYLRANGTIPDLWYDGTYTEAIWLDNLRQIALRYKDKPGFIGIDIKNEPNENSCTWGDGNPATDWKLASEKAYNAINSVNSDILIIVEWLGTVPGIAQLTSNPPNIPRNRLSLSPHVYGPDVWWDFGEGFLIPGYPNNMYPIWDRMFGNDYANGWSIIVGEFGGQYGLALPQDKDHQDKFSDYLRDRDIRDFTYWGWGDNSGGDTGGIIADGGFRNVRQDKMLMLNKIWNSEAKFTQATLTSVTPPPNPGTNPGVTASVYRTSGKHIFHNGNRIQLFGVNVIGAELKEAAIHGLWTSLTIKQFLTAIKTAGFNTMRIPVGPKMLSGVPIDSALIADWLPENAYLIGKNSLEVFDEWIKESDALGLRYIFDIHYLREDGSIPDLWYDGEYTDSKWIQNMQQLALRYKGKPGFVGIDIKNEPWYVTATWGDGNIATDFRLAANRAYTAINAVNSDIVIFVSSIVHSGGFTQILANPPLIPADRLSLTVHIYGPDVWNPLGADFTDPDFPNNMPNTWDSILTPALTDKHILLGEFGGEFGEDDPREDDWQIAFVDYLMDRGVDDFTYWGWGPNAGEDTGGILRDDWRTVFTAKMDNLLRMKTVYATYSHQTSTPVVIPPVVIEQNAVSRYRARGNRILHNGHDIQIYGVNIIGAELNDAAIGGLWSSLTIKQYLTAIKTQGFNTLRIPIGPKTLSGAPVETYLIADWMPENAGLIGLNSLQLMDEWINEAEELGLRYIFDLHYLRPNGTIPDLWYDLPDYPESTWLNNLTFIANHYKGNLGFIGIDIKNEPNENSCTWGNGNLATDWRLASKRAYDAINSVNSDILVIVEWLGTYPGIKQMTDNLPAIPLDRLVLSPHVYGPDVWWDFGEGFLAPNFPANMPLIWERMFGEDAQSIPILIGEFGGQYGRDHPLDDDWQNAFVEYLKNRNVIHFTYWGWGTNSGDDTGGILEDDWRTVRTDKMLLLGQLKTSQSSYTPSTNYPITPVDPVDPGDPGDPGAPPDNGGTPEVPDYVVIPVDPDYPFDSQYPVKPITRKKVGVDYRSLLIKLFPRGRAWRIEKDTVTYDIMGAFAVELQRVDFAVDRLITEGDPRTTIDNLTEWEHEYGLPDECRGLADNFADRRVALVRKIIATGGQSEAYYRSLISGSRVKIITGEPTTLPMQILGPVRGLTFKFIWFVDITEAEYTWFSADDSADSPINVKIDVSNIVCLLLKYKPAHTHIEFISGS